MEYQELTPEQAMQLENEKNKIERETTRIEKSLDIGETLKDLMTDDRYKKVFDEFYLKDEVIRETMLLSEQYFLDKDQRQSLQDGLIAKAHFNDWVTSTTTMGTLSLGRLQENANRLKEIETMLDVGYPIQNAEVLPPEGER